MPPISGYLKTSHDDALYYLIKAPEPKSGVVFCRWGHDEADATSRFFIYQRLAEHICYYKNTKALQAAFACKDEQD